VTAAQTRTNRIVLGLAVLALVVVIGAAIVVVLAIRDADERLPEITAYGNGRSITVAPAEYCTLDLRECSQGELAVLDVNAGQPLQLSLPKEISDAPWRLVAVFEDPVSGELVPEERYFESGATAALTVVSDREPPWQLAGVEIQLPSAVVDESGLPRAHAVWAIKTA
jgi:hypothetical protein